MEHTFIHSPRVKGGATVIGKGSVGLGADCDAACALGDMAKMRDWAVAKQRQRDADRARQTQQQRESEESRKRFSPRLHSPTRSETREMNMLPAMAVSSSPQRVREYLRRQELAEALRREQAMWASRQREEQEAQRAYICTMHSQSPQDGCSTPRKGRCSSPPAEYVDRERSQLLHMKACWMKEAKDRCDEEFQALLQRHHDVAKGHYNALRSREEDQRKRLQSARLLHRNKLSRDDARKELHSGHTHVIHLMKQRNVAEGSEKRSRAREAREQAVHRLAMGEREDSEFRLGTLAEREAHRRAAVEGLVRRVRPQHELLPVEPVIEERPSTAEAQAVA